MTRRWNYYLASPDTAAKLLDSPDHQVWSAQWTPGLPTTGTPAFVVVASAAATPPVDAKPLASALLDDDKNPVPPPPPPPPATSLEAFGDSLGKAVAGMAPRSIE